MLDESKLDTVRQHVRELAGRPSFRHRSWFVKYHLEIVEAIARELLEIYPEAEAELVLVAVWMHDYGKIIDFDTQHEHEHIAKGGSVLQEFGYDTVFAQQVAGCVAHSDRHSVEDLHQAPIEVKILSTADACSHFASPFHPIYWYENPDVPLEKMIVHKPRKIHTDWERKIVLPEARKVFKKYYDVSRVQAGELLERYLA